MRSFRVESPAISIPAPAYAWALLSPFATAAAAEVTKGTSAKEKAQVHCCACAQRVHFLPCVVPPRRCLIERREEGGSSDDGPSTDSVESPGSYRGVEPELTCAPRLSGNLPPRQI